MSSSDKQGEDDSYADEPSSNSKETKITTSTSDPSSVLDSESLCTKTLRIVSAVGVGLVSVLLLCSCGCIRLLLRKEQKKAASSAEESITNKYIISSADSAETVPILRSGSDQRITLGSGIHNSVKSKVASGQTTTTSKSTATTAGSTDTKKNWIHRVFQRLSCYSATHS